MKIILIGYMGSGKSTIGKLLADELSIGFIDLDKLIEKNEKKSMTKIFEEGGENFFREKERKHLIKTLRKKNVVIATGGGTPCFFNNLELINRNALSVYLKISVKKLLERLSENNEIKNRPLLRKFHSTELLKFIREQLKEREKFYVKANWIIRIGEKSQKKVAMEIKLKIRDFIS